MGSIAATTKSKVAFHQLVAEVAGQLPHWSKYITSCSAMLFRLRWGLISFVLRAACGRFDYFLAIPPLRSAADEEVINLLLLEFIGRVG